MGRGGVGQGRFRPVSGEVPKVALRPPSPAWGGDGGGGPPTEAMDCRAKRSRPTRCLRPNGRGQRIASSGVPPDHAPYSP